MGGRGSRIGRVALAVLIAASAAASPAQPFPPAPPDRRETVAGWQVVHVNDEDGGRDVGMRLDRGGIRIDYSVNFWRGNGVLYHRAELDRAGTTCHADQWEGAPGERDFRAAGYEQGFRERLIGYLEACGLERPQAEQALQGFAPAFARLAAFAALAQAHTDALNCSIQHYPEGEEVVRRLCHRR